jgi:flagellar protein FlaG
MSFNLSVGGSSGIERSTIPTSADPVSKSPKAADSDLGNFIVPPLSPNINNTQELKQAELQGEHLTISDAQLVKAIEHAIKAVQGKTTSLEFSIHQRTKLISVKVLDKDTGEIIREIPPEKSLDFVAKLWEMAGILVDERR